MHDPSRDRDKRLSITLNQLGPIPLDADFSCGSGEVLALVGPSGGGKSTILRSIAGLYRPRGGRILCGGNVWFDADLNIFVPPHVRSVGLVFQSYALFPHMTALGNIMTALSHLPRAERRVRAAALLDLVHLSGLEDRYPAALSGGQQQRVAVARALARDPAVLLLDEPFSAVDRVTRQKLYRELAELRRTLRMPVVLVTHDLEEAAMLADRMCVLHRGRTLQAGPPSEILSRPATVEAARLVDLKNLFEGRVVEHRPEAGLTMLAWNDRLIEARHQPDFPVGAEVSWLVPSGAILMHRRDRPSRGERENPVRATVSDALRLGENLSLTLHVEGRETSPLWMSVPVHVAQRNRIEVGAAVTVSLLAENVHLMPRG